MQVAAYVNNGDQSGAEPGVDLPMLQGWDEEDLKSKRCGYLGVQLSWSEWHMTPSHISLFVLWEFVAYKRHRVTSWLHPLSGISYGPALFVW